MQAYFALVSIGHSNQHLQVAELGTSCKLIAHTLLASLVTNKIIVDFINSFLCFKALLNALFALSANYDFIGVPLFLELHFAGLAVPAKVAQIHGYSLTVLNSPLRSLAKQGGHAR